LLSPFCLISAEQVAQDKGVAFGEGTAVGESYFGGSRNEKRLGYKMDFGCVYHRVGVFVWGFTVRAFVHHSSTEMIWEPRVLVGVAFQH